MLVITHRRGNKNSLWYTWLSKIQRPYQILSFLRKDKIINISFIFKGRHLAQAKKFHLYIGRLFMTYYFFNLFVHCSSFFHDSFTYWSKFPQELFMTCLQHYHNLFLTYILYLQLFHTLLSKLWGTNLHRTDIYPE